MLVDKAAIPMPSSLVYVASRSAVLGVVAEL